MPKRKSNYGKKKEKKCLPGTVSLKMCISPGIGQKPKMVKVPYIGSFTELAKDAGNYGKIKDDPVTVDTDLTELFVRSWYLKLRKAKALKIVFIDFMQQCVRASYYGHLPNWFKKRIRYKSSDASVKEYFLKARRILGAYLLYQFDTGGRAQGNLLTEKSLRNMMAILMEYKYGTLPPYQQMSKILSRLSFKPYEALLGEVKAYDRRLKSIFDIIREIDHSHQHRNSVVTMTSPRAPPDGTGSDAARVGGICKNLFARFVKLVKLVMNHPEGYIQIALADRSFTAAILRRDATAGQKTIVQHTPPPDDDLGASASAPAAAAAPTVKPPKPRRRTTVKPITDLSNYDEEQARQEWIKNQKVGGLTRSSIAPPASAPPAGVEYHLEPAPIPIGDNKTEPPDGVDDIAYLEAATLVIEMNNKPDEVLTLYNKADPSIQQYIFPKPGSSFGRRRRYRRSRFGRSPNLAQMTGYVRPYMSSSMERYTGMTPAMYRRHINSRTGNPMGQRGPGLSRANNYYGSSALGRRLNPPSAYGRRKQRKKCGGRRKKCKTVTKKRRRCRKKQQKNEFGKFFF